MPGWISALHSDAPGGTADAVITDNNNLESDIRASIDLE